MDRVVGQGKKICYISTMKIALVQTNPTIGDFESNVDRICLWAAKAKDAGCSLVIFPELAVSGYPPQDLLDRGVFLEDQQRAVDSLMKRISGISVLCGLFTRHIDNDSGKPLHNSAILFDDQGVQMVHKRLLPTYDVFDEGRYFEPGRSSLPITCQGLNLGVTICEDLFNYRGLSGDSLYGGDLLAGAPVHRYGVDPVTDLLQGPGNKVDMLINIAASPFSLDKTVAKLNFFKKVCLATGLPLLYVNQVGGQDSLLFDGQSMVVATDGSLLGKAAAFREDMLIYTHGRDAADAAAWQMDNANGLCLASVDTDTARPQEAFGALVMGTRDYVKKCGFKSVVLGLSGGVDSALVAAIASSALGPENVLGVALPSPYSSSESVEDARQLAENLGIGFEIIPINDIYEVELQALAPLFHDLPHDITEQNIQARIRGNLLMALANKFGYLLLSTGNKSEMAVGYCTLYGDMSGGLAVISDVPKMLVYQICRYLNTEAEIIPLRTISKPPSAELALDQKDEDDLPPYSMLDPILAAYLEDNKSVAEIVDMGFDKGVVNDVVRRITINEHKRKQAPLGLRITSKAFGCGRRYPITQGYHEKG